MKPNQGLVLKSSAVGRLAAFFTIFLFLTSCGGGGGGAGPSSPGSPPPSPGVATTPVITMQPAPASVPVYRDATFTVAATGNGMLSYQWYAGYGFPEITSPITGATSPTLTLRSVTVAVPARSYYCVVTNTLNGTTATATSIQSLLTVLAQRSTVTLSGESAVLPGSAGHVVSTPAQSGVTYSWTVTNGIITSGQGTNQVTYTAGSLGHTVLTLTILTPTGLGVASQDVAVVASVPIVSVFAQPRVLPGSSGVLASAPLFPGQAYTWTLTSLTATATITSGQTADVLTYSVGALPGTYQAAVGLTDPLGNHGSANEIVSVVSNAFVPDARDSGPRSLHTATLLNDGRVLIVGGDAGVPAIPALNPVAGPQSVILASAELFDPATETFAPVGSLANARFEHTATLLNDGRVLIVGGANGSSAAQDSTEIYDPTSRTFTAGPALTTARALHTATLLSDGRVLVVGGSNTFGSVDAAEIYDPVANAWSAAGTMVAARAWPAASLLPDGKVLVVGGSNSSSGLLASAELYDPATNTWTATASMPASGQRGDSTVLLLSGQVYEPGLGAIYDPQTASWSGGGTGAASFEVTAALLHDGRVFIGGTLLNGSSIYDPVALTSTSPGPNPASNSYSSTTVLADGRVLVVGGVPATFYATQGFYYNTAATAALVDPIGLTVKVVSAGGHQGALAASAVLPGGKVLFSGGFLFRNPPYSADVTDASDLYDPTINAWTPAAKMNTARAAHTATTLGNGSVLAVGGYNDQSALSAAAFASAELYDAQNNAWTSASAMANPRYEHTASLLATGEVLVTGGSSAFIGTCSCTTFLSASELYEPATKTWRTTGSLATARYAHKATVLSNGKVLVTGGFGGVPNTLQNVGGAALATTEIYDPSTGVWSPGALMITARYNHTAALLPSGQVLVAGGTDMSGNTLASAEVYDPIANTWTAVGSLTTPRQSHAAVSLANGRVLVVGGYNTSANATFGVGGAELYDPVAKTFSSAGAMSSLRQGFTLTALGNGRVMLVGGLPNIPGLPEFYQ